MKFRVISALAVLALTGVAQATPVTVQELGIGANHVVTIKSSTLNGGNAVNVYAGVVKLKVNGVATDGFCIDPFHWSIGGVQSYTMESLWQAPKPPGPMGVDTALTIDRLWEQYYSPTISNNTAAGLQIAIWTLVDQAISGGTFQLVSSNDYGATSMINWANTHTTAATAPLVGLTGPGQDYTVSNPVPDGGATIGLLGIGLLVSCFYRRRGASRHAVQS